MRNYKNNQPSPRTTVNQDKSQRATHFRHLLIRDLQRNLFCSLSCFQNENLSYHLLGNFTYHSNKHVMTFYQSSMPVKWPHKNQIPTDISSDSCWVECQQGNGTGSRLQVTVFLSASRITFSLRGPM